MSDEKRDPASPPADDAPQIHFGTLVRKMYPPPHPDMQPLQGRVTEIRRHLMANPSLDTVCFVDVHGTYREAQRSDLEVIHEEGQAHPPAAHDTFIPDSPDATTVRGDDGAPIPQGDPIPAPSVTVDAMEVSMIRDAQRRLEVSQAREKEALETIRELRKDVAHLEAELERIPKALNEKYAALERDRDFVESAMREASRRADHNERNLKVVLQREEMLRAKLREADEAIKELREDVQARENIIANNGRAYGDVRRELDHERGVSREALESAEAQAKRGDLWQDAAHDALEQAKLWRERAQEERAACARIMDERLTWQQRAEELRKAHELRETIERGIPVYNVTNVQMPPVNNEPDTRHESDDY